MSELQQFVKKLTKDFSDITCRKAYGSDSFYVREKIFAVITEDDRVALKVEDYETGLQIQKISGVEDWVLNNKKMEDWYLLPTSFNKKKNRLYPVLEMSYRVVLRPKKKKEKHKHKKKQKPSVVANKSVKAPKIQDKKSSLFSKIKGIFAK